MNISTNKTLSTICWPLIKLCQWMGRHTPETLVKIRFYAKFKRWPRLKRPIDLNEKILWLKLYSDTSRWTELADKYLVRKYVEDIGLGKYLVTLYGIWDTSSDVDFEGLPNSVIFKVNNGDGKGTNLIVRDLAGANKNELRKTFSHWLTRKHIGELAAEPHYKNMSPCIIAEEVLKLPEGNHSLVDYKIWCINGEPMYIWTCNNRDKDGGGADVMTYDLEWNAHPEYCVFTSEYRRAALIPKPKKLEDMLAVAKTLSKGFPILRVDLYNIDGKIYFGELTFTSQGGLMDFYSQDFLHHLGEKADISNIKKIK